MCGANKPTARKADRNILISRLVCEAELKVKTPHILLITNKQSISQVNCSQRRGQTRK